MQYSRSPNYFIIICLVLLGLSAGFLLAKAVQGATVNFDLSNDGTASSLIGGPLNPDWFSITTGNTYNWSLSAAGNDYWEVEGNFDYFVSLFLLDSGVRVAGWTASFLLDGSVVRTRTEQYQRDGQITYVANPIPAAIWLFGTALIGVLTS